VLEADVESYYYWWWPEDDAVDESEMAPIVRLTTIDLSKLPKISVAGSVDAEIESEIWNGRFSALHPVDGTLVWSGGGYGYWGGPWLADIAIRPWWGSGGERLLAFDVSTPAAPELVSDLNLSTERTDWWSFSESHTAGGLVFLGHQSSVLVPDPDTVPDPATRFWVQKYFVDVIDYADPTTPTVRNPVNVPGSLIGVSHAGAILYTQGPHWDSDWQTDGYDWIEASAYDGVEAHRVDSIELPRQWPRPTLLDDGVIYLGRPGEGDASVPDSKPNVLESWTLNGDGLFQRLASVELETPVSNLMKFDDLLVLNDWRLLRMFDAADPADLMALNEWKPVRCFWSDLARADGSVSDGLWLPHDDYGVSYAPTDE
jgi:hypothetical protein